MKVILCELCGNLYPIEKMVSVDTFDGTYLTDVVICERCLENLDMDSE